MTSPLRNVADYFFSQKKYKSAMECYKRSINDKEDGLVYSYINGAFAAYLLKDFNILSEYIMESVIYYKQDSLYFRKRMGDLIYKSLLIGVDIDIERFKSSLGVIRLDIEENTKYLFIMGFPRCGTTSIADNLLKTGEYIDSISPEPLTDALSMENYEDAIKIWQKTIWKWPGENGDVVIEKSTHHLLCDYYLNTIMECFPNQQYIVAIRDPYERAISAFQFSLMQGGVADFNDSINKEIKIIASLGGVKKIYFSREKFLSLLGLLYESSIFLPIVYTSVVMVNFHLLCPPDILNQLSFVNLEEKKINGKSLGLKLNNFLSSMSQISNRSEPVPNMHYGIGRDFFLNFKLQ